MSTLHPYSHPTSTVKSIKDYSYALTNSIGKGFSSTVYKGQHDPTGEEVAIKVINMKMLKNKSHRDLLNSQISCLKKTQGCRGIIKLKDVFETANNTYIITELCRGGDLDKSLNSRKLPEKQAIEYMKQIISGYLELSKRQILHRDLKPANIFISGKELIIADLGFAVQDFEKKKNNINVGSPLYMPPESLKNNEYSFKSDIWALGVIFYEMLFGQTPWKANTEKELPRKMIDIPIVKIVPPGSISKKSLQFLMRTLTPQVKYRMSPEQLQVFSFEQSTSSSILHQSSSKFSSKQRTFDSMIGKSLTSTITSNCRTNEKERKVGMIQSNHPNPQKYHPSILTPKTQCSQRGAKELTNQFLSQIHLCRFIYKIISSLKQVMRECQPLKDNLIKYIYSKLSTIKNMDNPTNFGIQDLDSFKQSSECNKIVSVCSKYLVKYQKEFGHLNRQSGDKLLKKLYENISFSVRSIWYQVEDLNPEEIDLYEKQIVLVDYLMTTYLLIKLETKSDIQLFHQKSKIEDIVEGNTHRVTLDHYKAIKEKIKHLGFI